MTSRHSKLAVRTVTAERRTARREPRSTPLRRKSHTRDGPPPRRHQHRAHTPRARVAPSCGSDRRKPKRSAPLHCAPPTPAHTMLLCTARTQHQCRNALPRTFFFRFALLFWGVADFLRPRVLILLLRQRFFCFESVARRGIGLPPIGCRKAFSALLGATNVARCPKTTSTRLTLGPPFCFRSPRTISLHGERLRANPTFA